MKCPRCRTSLQPIRVDDLDLHTCPSCQGLWFEADELRQAKDLADEELSWLDFEIWKHENEFDVTAHEAQCPRCDKPLFSLKYGSTGVALDHCPICQGVWLDGGEFEKIVGALEDEMQGKSMGELVSTAVKEAIELVKGPEPAASEWRGLKHLIRLIKLRFLVDRPGLRRALLAAQENSPFH